jgi:flagellar protein FliS
MSYATQAASYRELEVLAAPPERLLLMLFDQALVQFERARIGVETGNAVLQTTALTRVRNIIGELLATLDFEQGGEIAVQLGDLYQFLLVQLLELGKRPDVATIRRLAGIVGTLRDGFHGAAESVATLKLSA